MSLVNTGIPVSLAFLIAGPIDRESHGLITIALTPLTMKSSIWSACLFTSRSPETRIMSYPCFLASASISSATILKKGLVSVNALNPIVPLDSVDPLSVELGPGFGPVPGFMSLLPQPQSTPTVRIKNALSVRVTMGLSESKCGVVRKRPLGPDGFQFVYLELDQSRCATVDEGFD